MSLSKGIFLEIVKAGRTVGTRQLGGGSTAAILDDDHETGFHGYSHLGWLTGREQTPGLKSFLTHLSLSSLSRQFTSNLGRVCTISNQGNINISHLDINKY